MKFKQIIIKQIQMQPGDFEEKIVKYLKKNHYRITEKCPDHIIFIDDEFSDRRSSRSDIHRRIGEGKFEFHSTSEQLTDVKLIYLTSITFPFSIMMLFSVLGMYIHSIGPIVMSFVFAIPIVFRIFYLKGNVFREILEC